MSEYCRRLILTLCDRRLDALLATYQPIIELGAAEAVYQLAAELLIDCRERSAAGVDPALASLMRAIAADLAAASADMELDAAAPSDDPEPGEEIAA